jgi:hypothetical protein
MDNSYYEELAARLYGLVIRLGDRLPAGQARWLHHVVDAGEYGLALEDMAGMLALAARMKLEDGVVPRALGNCPEAG